MVMELDPAIVRALKLDPSKTQVHSHGGSGFSRTAKVSSILNDGSKKYLFMKTGRGEAAKVMFEGEHASLNAIHAVVPSLCPVSFASGQLENSLDTSFLITDFLNLSNPDPHAISKEVSSGSSLAAKLAKLHTTPAPTPKGLSGPMFGFAVTTCCGDTPQKNDYRESWAAFYAENRLRAILERSEQRNGEDFDLRSMVERTADVVVPRLLGDEHLNNGRGVMPVVVHGDLWSGNKGRGRIGGSEGMEEVVFDPSACYAHSEYELGIMSMFGGFSSSFFEEYHRLCPKTEPVAEYEDRLRLYEL
ncbi:1-phosphatidylinositol-3-phosphate 5-kinase [Schaereria dolodes]|nr:1-phosphatidylinositol-3-phosphate 5-kinase [Schaereria dolodes]